MAFSLFELFAANMIMSDVAKAVDAHERAHREEISRLSEQIQRQSSYEAERYEISSYKASAKAYNDLVEAYNGLVKDYRDLEKKLVDSLESHRDSLVASRNFMDGTVRNFIDLFREIRRFVRAFKAEADSKNFSEEDLHAAFYFRAAFYKIIKQIDEAICENVFDGDDTDENLINSLNGAVKNMNTTIKNCETAIKSYM